MKFSQEDRDAFSKLFTEVSNNSFENINKRDEKGETILYTPCSKNLQSKKVRLLIEKGAEINARDNKGFTLLHWAALAKRLENVKELIRSGAEINATEYDSKHTTLHCAGMVGAGSIIKVLVKAGAAINQQSKFGCTPMYWLMDNEKNKEAKKFMEKKGGVIKDRPEVCDEIAESAGKMVEVCGRKYLPKLEGKVIGIEEIRKRDPSLIRKDFNSAVDEAIDKINELMKVLDEK